MSDIPIHIKTWEASRPPRNHGKFGIILANELREAFSRFAWYILAMCVITVTGLISYMRIGGTHSILPPHAHDLPYFLAGFYPFRQVATALVTPYMFLSIPLVSGAGIRAIGKSAIEPMLASSVRRRELVLARFAAMGAVLIAGVCLQVASAAVVLSAVHGAHGVFSTVEPDIRLCGMLIAVMGMSCLAILGVGMAVWNAPLQLAITVICLLPMVIVTTCPGIWLLAALTPLSNGVVGIHAILEDAFRRSAAYAGHHAPLYDHTDPRVIPIMLVSNLIIIVCSLVVAVRNAEHGRGL